MRANGVARRQTSIELKFQKWKAKRKKERRIENSMGQNLIMVSIMTFLCTKGWLVNMFSKWNIAISIFNTESTYGGNFLLYIT